MDFAESRARGEAPCFSMAISIFLETKLHFTAVILFKFQIHLEAQFIKPLAFLIFQCIMSCINKILTV